MLKETSLRSVSKDSKVVFKDQRPLKATLGVFI